MLEDCVLCGKGLTVKERRSDIFTLVEYTDGKPRPVYRRLYFHYKLVCQGMNIPDKPTQKAIVQNLLLKDQKVPELSTRQALFDFLSQS